MKAAASAFTAFLVLAFLHQHSCIEVASVGPVISYRNAEDLKDKYIRLMDKPHSRVARDTSGGINATAATEAPKELDDNHQYYTSSIRTNHEEGRQWTSEFDRIFSTYEASSHTQLNDGHRIGLILTLRFPFVFYGHTVNRIVVTTGGYIYMNNVTHSYLGFSQYVAPLMADFDTKHNSSGIKWIDTEDSFWVRWENLQLNESRSFGNFSFQCAIFKNGSIIFDYISIPTNFHEIKNSTVYKVHIGLSDAYYYDYRYSGFIYRYIVKYHSVDIDYHHIVDDTVINFDHLTTCNMLDSCEVCNNASSHVASFNCSWCHAMAACSSGTDRQLQAWQNNDCHNSKDVCHMSTASSTQTSTVASSTQTSTTASSTQTSTVASSTQTSTTVKAVTIEPVTNSTNSSKAICAGGSCDYPSPLASTAGGISALAIFMIVLVVFTVLACLGTLVFFFAYGYRNPNSRFGQWMIENRPSRLRERMPDIGFSSKEGAVYKVDGTYDNMHA